MKKKFMPEDMERIRYLSYPAVTADGSLIAWVETTGNSEDGSFRPNILVWDSRTKEIRRLTDEGGQEKQPVFYRNGKVLVYLARVEGVYQIFSRDLVSGTVRQLTTLRHGVIRFSLSEKNGKIAFEALLWPEDVEREQAFCQMDAGQRQAWEKELDMRPYFITDLTYKMDEWYGMRKGEFSHIGTVNLDGSCQTIIDTGGIEAVFPVWSHDEKNLAWYGYPYGGAKGRQAEVFVCREDGSSRKQLTEDAGIYPDVFPAFTADDGAVIAMAFPEFEDGSCMMLPCRVDIETGQTVLLMDEDDDQICHGVHPAAVNRTEYGEEPPYFLLSGDGTELYFQSAYKGRGQICRINLVERGKTELVKNGRTDIFGFAMTEDKRIVCLMGDASKPPELYFEDERLAWSNDWLEEYHIGKTDEYWTKSRNGETDIQWFYVHPVREEQAEAPPAVLYVKGGPETVYNLNFWHEFQALAARGIAVIYANPRGSVGFGRAFCSGGICWKNEAMEDLLDVVDDAVNRGLADRRRLGVTGGSYGGYMTNKLIGRTDYFAAAVTQRCLANPATSYGTGDMGFVFQAEVAPDFKMLDYLTDRARGNIISYIDHMKTPLLILHGYRDYRCSFEQAEQMFIAMKERNPEIPVRLVMFPEENHNITRTGKLYNQIRHLSELTDWFDRFLNGNGRGEKNGKETA